MKRAPPTTAIRVGRRRAIESRDASTKEKKLCDQALSTLFTTKDAVELQRAMFLIRQLDCKISSDSRPTSRPSRPACGALHCPHIWWQPCGYDGRGTGANLWR